MNQFYALEDFEEDPSFPWMVIDSSNDHIIAKFNEESEAKQYTAMRNWS